jgi:hypothetical protein
LKFSAPNEKRQMNGTDHPEKDPEPTFHLQPFACQSAGIQASWERKPDPNIAGSKYFL